MTTTYTKVVQQIGDDWVDALNRTADAAAKLADGTQKARTSPRRRTSPRARTAEAPDHPTERCLPGAGRQARPRAPVSTNKRQADDEL